MLFCIKELRETEFVETISYQDLKKGNWVIHRRFGGAGMFLVYQGKSKIRNLFVSVDGTEAELRNTGIFFIKEGDLDTFLLFRDLIIHSATKDIWCSLEELIENRLLNNSELYYDEELIGE